MAGRRTQVLDIREMVRRFKLDETDRQVARELETNRRTVAKYRRLAIAAGWLQRQDLPTAVEIEQIRAATSPPMHGYPESTVEPHRVRVKELLDLGVEATAIWQILRDQHGYAGSYASVLRFVRRLDPMRPEAFVRVETPAGQEAQVDFGYAGLMVDSRSGMQRRAWVFVMTLSFSRHQYAEVVFDQTVETWLACHVHAFEWFGGVPRTVVLDNLKAAITKASFDDPQVQRSYRELAEHYNFTIAPCRPRTPRHKGKVESAVHYVKRNGLAGRTFANEIAANEHLRQWAMTTAGTRDHGTTHEAPLARFEAIEKAVLQPLPTIRYELAVWKEAKLHPDCHVVFDSAFYSAPHRLVGKSLLIRATRDRVEIHFEHERVATHPRAQARGERVTDHVHYPPDKLAGFLVTPVRLREQAREIGPSAAEIVETMLAEKPVDRLRAAQGILALAKRHDAKRLEAACCRALLCGDTSRRVIAEILKRGMECFPLPPEVTEAGPVPKTAVFARSAHEIAQSL